MSKDKTWAMNQINNLDGVRIKGRFADFTTIPKDKAIRIISDMDEPEVLSQEFIKDNQLMKIGPEGVVYYVPVENLQSLLVPEQEEVDRAYKDGYEKGKEHATKVIKPTIPKFMAEVIEEDKERGYDVYDSIDLIIQTNGGGIPSISDWVAINIDKYARAWVNGYMVEEEQKYVVPVIKNLYLKQSESGDFGVGSIPSEMKYEFTEQEIKDYDPRYWAFRKPVEELEE